MYPADLVDGKWVPEREGLRFMQEGIFPQFSTPSAFEPWKPAEREAMGESGQQELRPQRGSGRANARHGEDAAAEQDMLRPARKSDKPLSQRR
eukprot:3115475-Pleurochrysis_carterae.AAC.1